MKEQKQQQDVSDIREKLELLDREIRLPESLSADRMRYRLEAGRVAPRRAGWVWRRAAACVMTLAVVVVGTAALLRYDAFWAFVPGSGALKAADTAEAGSGAEIALYRAAESEYGSESSAAQVTGSTPEAAPHDASPVVSVSEEVMKATESGGAANHFAAGLGELAAAVTAAQEADDAPIALAMEAPQEYSTPQMTVWVSQTEDENGVTVEYRGFSDQTLLCSYRQQGDYVASHLRDGVFYLATVCEAQQPAADGTLTQEDLPGYNSSVKGAGHVEAENVVIPARASGSSYLVVSATGLADFNDLTVCAVLSRPQQLILRQASCEMHLADATAEEPACDVLLEFDGTGVVLAG